MIAPIIIKLLFKISYKTMKQTENYQECESLSARMVNLGIFDKKHWGTRIYILITAQCSFSVNNLDLHTIV